MDKKTTEFYERLRLELNNNTSWPTKYLFKFIVPNEQIKIDEVELREYFLSICHKGIIFGLPPST